LLREGSSDGNAAGTASIVGTMSANIKTPATASNYPELALFIDGEWLGPHGRKSQPVINPATEEVLGQLPHASAADLDRALAAAQRAWGEWRALLPVQRGKILKKAADIMRSRAEERARAYCDGKGKTMRGLVETDARPPYIQGNFARVELIFECTTKKPG